MRNIYITGDTHSNFERIDEFCKENNTNKEDLMIILGDVGVNYFEDKRDYKLKRLLENIPITFFMVHGNHEIRPKHISSYKKEAWNNGYIYREERFPSLIFPEDGNIFIINSKRFLVLGGAYSIDKYYRVGNGLLWMEDEQPSIEDINKAYLNLEKNDGTDYVLTHTAPFEYIPFANKCTEIDKQTIDITTEKRFQELYDKASFEKWFCGHFHIEKDFGRIQILHKNIIHV